MILKIFEVTKDFPKEYKYTLGQDMKRDALQLVRSIYRANKSTHKKEHLETFLDEFEILKLDPGAAAWSAARIFFAIRAM